MISSRDPVVVNVRVTGSRSPSNFVPSTATTPDLTSPAFAHNRNTEAEQLRQPLLDDAQ